MTAFSPGRAPRVRESPGLYRPTALTSGRRLERLDWRTVCPFLSAPFISRPRGFVPAPRRGHAPCSRARPAGLGALADGQGCARRWLFDVNPFLERRSRGEVPAILRSRKRSDSAGKKEEHGENLTRSDDA
jgi:hypothetical protein